VKSKVEDEGGFMEIGDEVLVMEVFLKVFGYGGR
jgi:hypothetical protein